MGKILMGQRPLKKWMGTCALPPQKNNRGGLVGFVDFYLPGLDRFETYLTIILLS